MNSLNVMDQDAGTADLSHLRRRGAIEQGRADALDRLVDGAPLEDVLTVLIHSIEASSAGLRCGIMLYDADSDTISPLAAPGVPKDFIAALQRFPVGPDMGSCGAAIYHRQPVYADDLATHDNWMGFREEAQRAGIKACWSHPIIAPDGELFGTFTMFFPTPTKPDREDKAALAYEAKIVSILLERARHLEQLQQANTLLELRVTERTKELTEANQLLKRALEQRNDVQSQLVEMENMAALGTMMSSLTHEINTPVGVAITAISHLRRVQALSYQQFESDVLKRSDLEKFYNECAESTDIVERNLLRSTELIKTFKQLSIDQHSQDARPFNLCGYVDEILLSLKPRLKRTEHKFCLNIDPDLDIISNPGAISQVLINLIMNSAKHAFDAGAIGQIHIDARVIDCGDGASLELRYADNGKGMSPHTIANIYKPFFTSARQNGGSGLGMHICYNLVFKVLGGTIDCQSTPGKGVCFTLTFPIELTQASAEI